MRLKLCEEHGTMTNHGLVCLKCRNEEKKNIEQARKDNVRIGAILECKWLKKKLPPGEIIRQGTLNPETINYHNAKMEGRVEALSEVNELLDKRIEELR